jgi:lysophospholipid acyltransferase (LPLAT)-like uncharacterized protein
MSLKSCPSLSNSRKRFGNSFGRQRKNLCSRKSLCPVILTGEYFALLSNLMKMSRPTQTKRSSEEEALHSISYWRGPRRFSLWQRVQIFLISQMSAWLIHFIGRSLRWESRGDENLESIYRTGKRAIFAFWHGRIFPAAWYWRKRGIVVMTSQNFDGEYIARCIQKHGYSVARGSSSRGGLKALAEMAQSLRRGLDVAFAVDGPRGPRYVAKVGPVLLARRTGDAIFCFHISLQHKLQLNNWDQSQIPLPFSRALVLKAPPIFVSREADEEQVNEKLKEMQAVLDQVREEGDAYWKVRSKR